MIIRKRPYDLLCYFGLSQNSYTNSKAMDSIFHVVHPTILSTLPGTQWTYLTDKSFNNNPRFLVFSHGALQIRVEVAQAGCLRGRPNECYGLSSTGGEMGEHLPPRHPTAAIFDAVFWQSYSSGARCSRRFRPTRGLIWQQPCHLRQQLHRR